MFAGYLFLRFKNGREIRQINPTQTLMNLQYMYYSAGCSISLARTTLGSSIISPCWLWRVYTALLSTNCTFLSFSFSEWSFLWSHAFVPQNSCHWKDNYSIEILLGRDINFSGNIVIVLCQLVTPPGL